MEVTYEYDRLSHAKPKAYGSVRHLTLEGKEEAAESESGEIEGSCIRLSRERSDWYCFGSDRQCLLRLCCALRIVLTWWAVIVIPRAFPPSLMVLQ